MPKTLAMRLGYLISLRRLNFGNKFCPARLKSRYLHYSIRTEESYLYWIRYFIRWSGVRHPQEMGAIEVRGFLTFLATEQNISISKQRVALSALLFLYPKVLCVELPWLDGLERPTVPRRLPAVLTVEEVASIFSLLSGVHAVLARPLYGTGVRITKALQLRISLPGARRKRCPVST